MSEQQYVQETWTYQGYYLSKGKLAVVWMDEAGQALVYGKSKDTEGIIGYKYTIEVNRADGSTRARFGTKVRQGHGPAHPDEDVARWRMESRAAEAQYDSERLEAKLRKENDDIGAMTLAEMRDMLRKRRGYKNRQALIAALLDYVEG